MTIQNINGCIGCGTCVKTCPTDVLRQDIKTKKAFIRYPADCQICHLCRMYCSADAITISPEKSIPVVVSWDRVALIRLFENNLDNNIKYLKYRHPISEDPLPFHTISSIFPHN